MSAPLKLTARDEEDLAIVSSCLQDAIVPAVEMKFLPAERCFILISSRFGWEDAAGDATGDTTGDAAEGKVYERVNCAVRFDGVASVKHRNIDRNARNAILSLLAIRPGRGYIDLIFSGGGMIRLAAGAIDCRLDDLDHRWPTRWKPSHDQG